MPKAFEVIRSLVNAMDTEEVAATTAQETVLNDIEAEEYDDDDLLCLDDVRVADVQLILKSSGEEDTLNRRTNAQ